MIDDETCEIGIKRNCECHLMTDDGFKAELKKGLESMAKEIEVLLSIRRILHLEEKKGKECSGDISWDDLDDYLDHCILKISDNVAALALTKKAKITEKDTEIIDLLRKMNGEKEK